MIDTNIEALVMDMHGRCKILEDSLLGIQSDFYLLEVAVTTNNIMEVIKYLVKVESKLSDIKTQLSVLENELTIVTNNDELNINAGLNPIAIRQMAVAITVTSEKSVMDADNRISEIKLKFNLAKS